MNSSNSGIISTEFINTSDFFSDYTDMSHGNHNRLVKAKRFGKWYMLKGLNAEYADKAVFVELLRKEFDLGISLDHPNIIRTIGKESNSKIGDCIVLEYIDGVTLKEWIKANPPKSERRRVVMQLLDAMCYFHGKGIIHRDLKPENILITRNGANVKVIDFGLSDSDEYAIFKQPVGSRKYAAPEQFTGGTMVDLRADLYAFGTILPDFGLSGIYKRIARKATRKTPADRYANAQQILSAIQNRHYIHRGAMVVLIGIFVGGGVLYLIQSEPQKQQTPLLTTDTVVREILRDTIVTTKIVPVVVEKVVLKDIGESDSTYIEREKWENSIKEKIKAEYKKLYAPCIEQCQKAQTMDDINQLHNLQTDLSYKLFRFNNEMMTLIGPDHEFYAEMVNFLACAGLSYNNEIAAKQLEITEKQNSSK